MACWKPSRTTAFTLIELLIVVAIIAILAAIAVPNFLEAQVRAKVSRAHADMRTLATGIEAYAVDNNKLPPSWHQLAPNSNLCSLHLSDEQLAVVYALSRLTTPVAYLGSIPPDPFRDTGQLKQSGNILVNDPSFRWYYFTPTYHDRKALFWPLMQLAEAQGIEWATYSVGPSRNDNGVGLGVFNVLSGFVSFGDVEPDVAHVSYPYDPTNGTVSLGWVIRTNQGIFEAPKDGWR